MWRGGGGGGGGAVGGVGAPRTQQRSSLSKGTWESKCWAYSFNHEELKITNWKVFDQDVYIFKLITGIERANCKSHTEAFIIIIIISYEV